MVMAVLLLIIVICVAILWIENTQSGKRFYKKLDKFMTERFWW